MDSGLDELRGEIGLAKKLLQDMKDGVAVGQLKKEAVTFARGKLGKAFMAMGRYCAANKLHAEGVAAMQEGIGLFGPSIESTLYLMSGLAGLDRWDEAWDAFLDQRMRGSGRAGYKHEMYDDPEVVLEEYKALAEMAIDRCSRLQRPVADDETVQWDWRRRFSCFKEMELVAGRYHRDGLEMDVTCRPFTYEKGQRQQDLHGLTDKGIAFVVMKGAHGSGSPYPVTEGKEYRVVSCNTSVIPNSSSELDDGVMWLATSMASPRES